MEILYQREDFDLLSPNISISLVSQTQCGVKVT